MAFQPRADLQNQAIGWLQREYSSLDGGTGVWISANLEVIWVMSVNSGHETDTCSSMQVDGSVGGEVSNAGFRARSMAGNRRATGQVFIPVGRLPVQRGLKLRAVEKPYAPEIGLGQVGAVDLGLE